MARHTHEPNIRDAPFALRACATIIDVIVVLCMLVVVLVPTYPLIESSAPFPDRVRVAIAIVVFVIYHGVAVWLIGQTIGKGFLGLSVKRIDSRRRSMVWSLGRASVGYFGVDFLFVGSLLALGRRRRALHDLAFKSRVLQHSDELPARAWLQRMIPLAERVDDAMNRRAERLRPFRPLWRLLSFVTGRTMHMISYTANMLLILEQRATYGRPLLSIGTRTAQMVGAVSTTAVVATTATMLPSPTAACDILPAGVAELALSAAVEPTMQEERRTSAGSVVPSDDNTAAECRYSTSADDYVGLSLLPNGADLSQPLSWLSEYTWEGDGWVEKPSSKRTFSWADLAGTGYRVNGLGDEAYATSPPRDVLAGSTLFVRQDDFVFVVDVGLGFHDTPQYELGNAGESTFKAARRVAELVLTRI